MCEGSHNWRQTARCKQYIMAECRRCDAKLKVYLTNRSINITLTNKGVESKV